MDRCNDLGKRDVRFRGSNARGQDIAQVK